VNELVAGYFKISPSSPRSSNTSSEEGEDDPWWETIEEKYANQDLGGFVRAMGGIRN